MLHYTEQLVPETYFDSTMNKVVYRPREREDLRVVLLEISVCGACDLMLYGGIGTYGVQK